MRKPGRNDPCPCGSGKKFKKCCGKDNVIPLDSLLYKNELDNLQEQLTTFGFDHYERELFEMVTNFTEKHFQTSDEESMNFYTELMMSWGFFNVPVKDHQTIYELFYQNINQQIPYPAVKDSFSNWNAPTSGAFEVQINGRDITFIQIETGKQFPASYDEKLAEEHGNILIGTLIPYPITHEVFISSILIPGEHLEELTHIMSDILSEEETNHEMFPTFVADVLLQGKDPGIDLNDYTWGHFTHKKAALTFMKHATAKGYDEDLIHVTIQYWSDYCTLNAPIVRKSEANAAALDYFSQRTFLDFTDVTQSQLGKEYGTTPGTISNHYKKLFDAFDSILDMPQTEASSLET